MRKVHYLVRFDGYKDVGVCGLSVDDTATNMYKVTCKNCLKILVARGRGAQRQLWILEKRK